MHAILIMPVCHSPPVRVSHDLQDVFTEDGLGYLWGELVQDGEMATAGLSNKDKREEGRHSVTARRSQFNHFLQEWTWGQVRKYACSRG